MEGVKIPNAGPQKTEEKHMGWNICRGKEREVIVCCLWKSV